MADKKISQLTGATTPLVGTEVLPIVQSGTTVKVANNDLRPKQIQSNATSGVLQVAGPSASTTRVMTTPDANFSAARIDAAQTFTGLQTFSRVTLTQDNSAGLAALTFPNDETTVQGPASNTYLRFGGNFTIGGAGLIQFNVNGNYAAKFDTNLNLVVGAANKGINFTANSAAAGMTSQLLNWYEEGTWTPVATFDSGTITTVSYSSAQYTRKGREVTVIVYVTMTNSGTGAGALNIAGLPFTSSSAPCSVFGQEQLNNGKGLTGYVNPTDNSLKRIRYADGASVAASGSAREFSITAIYFV